MGDLVNADVIMNDTFWVGIFPGLDQSMLGYLADELGEAMRSRDARSA